MSPMTGKQLKAWRKRMRLKVYEAAAALDVSRATYTRWEAAPTLPRHVGLACQAISLNLPPAEG